MTASKKRLQGILNENMEGITMSGIEETICSHCKGDCAYLPGARLYLFRGKRVDNNEWVYGSFIPDLCEIFYGDNLDGFIKEKNG